MLVSADESERETLRAGAAALAGPVPLAPNDDGAAEPPFSTLHGLYWLTVNLAGTDPLLFVVDDTHRADLASLRWLVYGVQASCVRSPSRTLIVRSSHVVTQRGVTTPRRKRLADLGEAAAFVAEALATRRRSGGRLARNAMRRLTFR